MSWNEGFQTISDLLILRMNIIMTDKLEYSRSTMVRAHLYLNNVTNAKKCLHCQSTLHAKTEKGHTSISLVRSNFGAFKILTFRMKTFCNG